MSLDKFFGRRYDERHYNCAHLAIDVWEHITGRKIVDDVAGFLIPARLQTQRQAVQGVQMLPAPVDPCFVLLRSAVRPPHVGVLYRGRVIHFAGNHKVQYQPPDVVTFGYNRIRYFTC